MHLSWKCHLELCRLLKPLLFMTDIMSVSRQVISISMFFHARAHVAHPQQLLKREKWNDVLPRYFSIGFVPATMPMRWSSLYLTSMSSINGKKDFETTQSSSRIIPYFSVSNIQSMAVLTPIAHPRFLFMKRWCTVHSQSIRSMMCFLIRINFLCSSSPLSIRGPS